MQAPVQVQGVLPDFVGIHAFVLVPQAVFVKPSPSILALRNAFTVEAVVLARSFGSGWAT